MVGGLAKEETSVTRFTWEEICRENSQGRLLVGVRGKVYDVTNFVDRHPGGREALLCSVGRDATQVFETYHPFEVKKLLHKFYVGELVSHELPTFPEPSEFFTTVKARVENYFRETNQDPKHAPQMWFRYACIFLTLIISWCAQFVWFTDNFLACFFFAALLGFCCALIGLLPMHDCSHFSITHKPWVWQTIGATHDFFNGASHLIWIYQHTLGHHPYTNIVEVDPDIVTRDDKDVRRIKWTQPWYYPYFYQHIYVPLLYCVLGLKTRIQDITILYFVRKNGVIRVNEPTTNELILFVSGKLFFITYRFVYPLLVMPLWKVLVLFAISDAVSSYWLALTFQANHVVEEVEWPSPDPKTGRINKDWAEMQIATTQDYSHDSWFWTVFSGGLNFQATHHLFPQVSQYYYPQISPIIRKTCTEFGLTFHYKNTFLEALGSHLAHLRTLGSRP